MNGVVILGATESPSPQFLRYLLFSLWTRILEQISKSQSRSVHTSQFNWQEFPCAPLFSIFMPSCHSHPPQRCNAVSFSHYDHDLRLQQGHSLPSHLRYEDRTVDPAEKNQVTPACALLCCRPCRAEWYFATELCPFDTRSHLPKAAMKLGHCRGC
jgi:hypothetical protein